MLRCEGRETSTVGNLAAFERSFIVGLQSSQSLEDPTSLHHPPDRQGQSSAATERLWDLPKGHILSVHPGSWGESDVKLRAVGIATVIGHSQHSWTGVRHCIALICGIMEILAKLGAAPADRHMAIETYLQIPFHRWRSLHCLSLHIYLSFEPDLIGRLVSGGG